MADEWEHQIEINELKRKLYEYRSYMWDISPCMYAYVNIYIYMIPNGYFLIKDTNDFLKGP